jgi:tetratricopeptide (TPR) repeat protein
MKYRQSEFVRIANRLQQEQAAARTIVDQVRRNPSAYLLSPPPEEWKTAGMVQELTEVAHALCQQTPEKSAALAELATIIVATLDESYPRVLRTQLGAAAWKEMANTHRYRSQYDAALRALDRADETIAGETALGYDRAVLALTRATTLREIDRLPEALRLLDGAAEVFREHGDNTRVAQCELLAGMIHHGQGATAFARTSYRTAAAIARDAGDVSTVA